MNKFLEVSLFLLHYVTFLSDWNETITILGANKMNLKQIICY